MSKVWQQTYIEAGIPDEICLPPISSSMIDIFERNSKEFADKTAYIFRDEKLSYKQVDHLSLKFAGFLQSLGLKKGARVAVMLPNILQYPISVMGILRAGLILVNVNPLYTPRELEHQLKDSGAEVIIVLDSLKNTFQQIAANTAVKHLIVTSINESLVEPFAQTNNDESILFSSALASPISTYTKPDLTLNDTAVLQYTGGTTGVSKGAELTHLNLVSNLLQNNAIFGPILLGGKQEQQNMICALPLYHIFAFQLSMMSQYVGFACVLILNPRDTPSLINEMVKHPPVLFPSVNTLTNALVNHEDIHKVDFSHIKLATSGGMATLPTTAEAWHKLTQKPLLEGYGLSETSPVVSVNPPNIKGFTGKIGIPLPSTEIAIIDDNGQEVPLNQEGEIAVRGPQVMKGYWNRPEETAQVMTHDGYFRTGDIGVMDSAGFVKIVDRKKDMILVSGFNVYPNEIEEVVSRHPKVLEAAAIGVMDEKSGEVPKLFIVKKDINLTENEIFEFISDKLTGYKQPKYIEFLGELPKSNVGKILRKELR
ncbi:AMP-binding protein [Acinetobacter oleivorans]|uniref:Long-chain-fatty-acid--CoA ligase n=1 Tax=Acinetobacter oleivorans TaxID=1148157 RepID=A0ABR9NEN3_9GAMM|nr:AMP-binding protein [Acinetobacter oleivorans]MBE2162975.1 AMP-binding protein [Acinetobacter oleivorans]MDY7371708.1 AMP-binding protein [Acinetobacter oleivorans]